MNLGKNAGFTIVELMVTVAIVSILSVLALNAYSDYATRAKVSEGMAFASEAKTGVLAAFYTGRSGNQLPTSNTSAGLPAASDYRTDIIASISVGSVPARGTITVQFALIPLATDNLLQLIPSTDSNGRVQWECRAATTNGMRNVFLPPNCRG